MNDTTSAPTPATPASPADSDTSHTASYATSTAAILASLAQDMARQSLPPATLYVMATPIGNRADVTVRCVYALHVVDAVAAEDTRVAGQWLNSLGLHKPLLRCDAHQEHEAAAPVLRRLAAGERVVLCSDAGTPAISDPGARLVAPCVQRATVCCPCRA